MKVLHFVKTSDGARWALEMIKELQDQNLDITVVLPSKTGKMVKAWEGINVKIIYAFSELPIKKPWIYFRTLREVKSLIELEKPDIIHSHFFSQTILLRAALKKSKIPLIFQVPGPLHLENWFFRKWDLLSARKYDSWIASSQYIKNIYINSKVSKNRVGLSYYGNNLKAYDLNSKNLREKYQIEENEFVIGNISYFYPPKAYLFQKTGLKGHELLIDIANKIKGKMILFGSVLGNDQNYFNKLKKKENSYVLFPGPLKPFEVSLGWKTMDICLHLPLSENCGGVLEPLLHGIPVVTCYTGGLSEVIFNKKTGLIVNRKIEDVTKALNWANENLEQMKKMTENGQKLVLKMFDVKRTALEIKKYYENINHFDRVKTFNSKEFVCENS